MGAHGKLRVFHASATLRLSLCNCIFQLEAQLFSSDCGAMTWDAGLGPAHWDFPASIHFTMSCASRSQHRCCCRSEIEGMNAILVRGDAMSTADVEKAFGQIEDADAVVSTIGGTPANPKADSEVKSSRPVCCTVCSQLTGSLIDSKRAGQDFCSPFLGLSKVNNSSLQKLAVLKHSTYSLPMRRQGELCRDEGKSKMWVERISCGQCLVSMLVCLL